MNSATQTETSKWDWQSGRGNVIYTATRKVKGFTLVAECIADPDADTSYLEQDECADRLEQYRNDQFSFLGIVVKAYRKDVMLGQSFGLWGIESDSGEDYFSEIANEEAEKALNAANAKLTELRGE